MTTARKRVLIVGGGITGLATAYYLQRQARATGVSVDCVLVEAAANLGGKVQTERTAGLVIEQGPDSFLARKPAARQLVAELGLADDLVGTNTAIRKTYIVHRRRLEPLPDSMMLVAPVRLSAYVKTRLLSPLGKLRAGLDLVLPPATRQADESLGAFVTRRLGREVATNLAGPLLAGIYAGDMDELSVLATFPQLRQLEASHGSLLRGLLAMQRRSGQQSATGSAFLTLRHGLGTLVQALVQSLDTVQIITGQAVVQLGRDRDASAAPFVVTLADGRELSATAVVLTLPAYGAAELLHRLVPAAADELARIPYVSTAAVALAYPASAAPRPLDATGFLVPPAERRVITGCTWVAQKWPHTTPAGQLLIRCFVGRAGSEAILAQDDATIVSAVATELRELMGLRGEPQLSRVYRWPRAMPQYVVGHQARVERIEQLLSSEPGLFVAGAGYDGIGLPDCIRQGEAAAAKAFAYARNVSASVAGSSR